MNKLSESFFRRDVLIVAPEILGKTLVRRFDTNTIEKYTITDVEAYRGEEDKACHASKGITDRTRVMYQSGGLIYVYLIYGMYWLLNFVTGEQDQPQALLIRGLKNIDGPGRVGRSLKLDKSFYGENLCTSPRLWLEDNQESISYSTDKRIGVDYAGDYWSQIQWRFIQK